MSNVHDRTRRKGVCYVFTHVFILPVGMTELGVQKRRGRGGGGGMGDSGKCMGLRLCCAAFTTDFLYHFFVFPPLCICDSECPTL